MLCQSYLHKHAIEREVVRPAAATPVLDCQGCPLRRCCVFAVQRQGQNLISRLMAKSACWAMQSCCGGNTTVQGQPVPWGQAAELPSPQGGHAPPASCCTNGGWLQQHTACSSAGRTRSGAAGGHMAQQ